MQERDRLEACDRRWVIACDLQIGDREISRSVRERDRLEVGGGVVQGEAGWGGLRVARGG